MASSDLVNMGISVVSYTIKDIRDEEVFDILEENAYISLGYWLLVLTDFTLMSTSLE